MIRYFAVFLVLFGCGSPYVDSLGSPGVLRARVNVPERCTIDTLQPEWECCDDDSLRCENTTLRICREHRMFDITDAECARVMEDPRRPEFQKFRDLCDRDGARWLICAPPAN